MFDYSKFTYKELRDLAMKSQKDAEPWLNYLKLLKTRKDAEYGIIKSARKTNPGLADYEILRKYNSYLEEHYPVPEIRQEKGF